MLSSRLLRNSPGPTKEFCRYLRFFKSKEESKNTVRLDQIPDVHNTGKIEEEPPKAIEKRNLPFLNPIMPIRQAWVENLNTLEPNYRGIIDLHPEVFGARPRLDLVYENYHWQRMYRYINWQHLPWKHEIRRSNKKPWPQGGSGKAHHGTRRSPLFKGGVKTFGPHGPETHFYMLTMSKRVAGLCSTLSVKLAQDDLHIVDNLEIPTKDPQYLHDLAESRKWGPSVLFIDVVDIMPKNISLAANEIGHMNLMPVYGLNCWSMLKHVTLVLTLDAVNRIEEKLLYHLHSPNVRNEKWQIK